MPTKKAQDLIGTQEAADALGVSRRQVQTLIKRGHLPATKLARDWFIKRSDLEMVRVRPKGRPPSTKKKNAKNTKPLHKKKNPMSNEKETNEKETVIDMRKSETAEE